MFPPPSSFISEAIMNRKLFKAVGKVESIIETAINNAKTEAGKKQLNEFTLYCKGYSEPGYDSEAVIVLGNFNTITRYDTMTRENVLIDDAPKTCADALEKAGADLQWEDEWIECARCGKLVRCESNGHGWRQAWAHIGYDAVCHRCICKSKKSRMEYLDSVENVPTTAITIEGIDLEKHGYVLLQDDLENGWYGGQAADPNVIAESLRKAKVFRFLFTLDRTSMFDLEFSVWVHKSEIKRAREVYLKTDGADPAIALKEGLKNAPIAMASVADEAAKTGGVTLVSCHPDGTATARVVPPQEFIDGVGHA